LRAAIALSVLMGTSVMRTILNLDVVQECDESRYREALAKLLEAALAH